jgi:type I restriction enzyme S subunit
MDFDDGDREILRLRPNDLLICEGGEPGRAAVWRGELEECYFQKALHRARPDPNLANAEYLSWLLWFLAQRGTLSGVTSATIAHLTGEKLAVLPTFLPPLSIQHEFTERVTAVEDVRRAHHASLAELDALFVSLQHRAFRGEL